MNVRLSLQRSLAGLLVLLLVAGCSWLNTNLEKPEIRVVDVKRLSGKNVLEQRFALRLHLTNPNDRRFHIQQLTFRFDVGERELMRGTSTDIPVIEPLGDVEFTVNATAHVVDTLQVLDQLTHAPGDSVGYTLHTQVTMASGWPSTFNLEKDGEVNLLDALTKKMDKKNKKGKKPASD